MTTIAWDGKTLAADKQATLGCLKFQTTKIFHLESANVLVGISGDIVEGLALIDWVKNGRCASTYPVPNRDAQRSFILIDETGAILKYEAKHYPIVIENSFFALGTGRDYAMAAMYMGASSEEAIRVAHQFDENTGSVVETLSLGLIRVDKLDCATLVGSRK